MKTQLKNKHAYAKKHRFLSDIVNLNIQAIDEYEGQGSDMDIVISHISSFYVSIPFFLTLHFPFHFQGFCLSIPFPLLLTFHSVLISIPPYFPFQTPLHAHPLVFLSVLLFHLHSYHRMPWYWYHKHPFVLDHVLLIFLLISLLFLTNPLVIFIPTIRLSDTLSI